MQYRILAVTIWSSIIGNLEFCTANDIANKYTGHLVEIQAYPQIIDSSLSKKLYLKNGTLYESTTEIITFKQDESSDRFSTFDDAHLRRTMVKNNETNDTNIVDLADSEESYFFQDSDNFGQKSRSVPLSNIKYDKYDISISHSRLKEANDQSGSPDILQRIFTTSSRDVSEIDKKKSKTKDVVKDNISIGNMIQIRNNEESTIASGINERTFEQSGLNDEERIFDRNDRIDLTIKSEKNDFIKESDSLSMASSPFRKLSGPIIVPDFPQLKASSSLLISEKTSDKSDNPEIQDVIGSTLVLNPLRVGVALVNAKENTLIDDDSENNQSVKCVFSSSTVQTEANTLDEEGAVSNNESTKACSNINISHEQFSKQSESPTFDEGSMKKKKADDTVEIQKSIEIYHNAPVQEIHYPVELSPLISRPVENIFQKTNVNNAINLDGIQKEFRISGEHRSVDLDVQPINSNFYISNVDDNIEEKISRTRQSIGFQEKPNNLMVDNSDSVVKKNNFPYISMGLYLSSDKRVESNSFPAQQSTSNSGNNIGIPILLLPGQSQDATSYEQYTDAGNIFNGISMTASGGNKHQTLNNFKSDKEAGDHHYVVNMHEERSEPSQYHLFQRIIQNNPLPLIETRYVLPISSPYSIIAKKSIEKPTYGLHSTELENVDNKVFYSIEKIMDKQASSPQQLAQIPNDKQTIERQTHLPNPYAFYVEKTGEKKIPQVIHRFIMQPYPIHIKFPSLSTEKLISPDHLENKIIKPNRKSYPIEAGKNSENVKVHSEEIDNHQVQPSQVHRSLQKFYAEVSSIPFYRNYINSSSIHENARKKPSFYFGESTTGYNNKNGHYNYLEQSSNSVPPKEIASIGNLRSYRRRGRIFEKDRTSKNKYMDSRQMSSSSLRMQLKSSPSFLVEAQQSVVPGIMRNTRQSEGYPLGDIGNFRQSKVEYGFKPPMIPSIQYDEQTASKVDK
ncbi:uncharacterized protein LOC124952547 [Vespa velutina]|uniref:uncharacterized protein LOC124952547 n=1 Tax=Vespa velutina TaxID=202808 RepID=UPI001FB45D37|nr:uncharacterized protein LOC124952547 [Vespa velutina]